MSTTIIYNLTVTDTEGKVLHEGSYFDIISIVHELPKIREVSQAQVDGPKMPEGGSLAEEMIPEIK